MPEKVVPGPITTEHTLKEAVCIHTKKIFDACRDKDCLEDLRVYPTRCSQGIIERASNVRCRRAELLWTYIDVEAVPFNRGFYTVDVKYFYRIVADAFCGVSKPVEVTGLATFDKRVILFGSEGNAKIFSSRASLGAADCQLMGSASLPAAIVEAVDPICLNVKLVEKCGCHHHHRDNDCDLYEVPECIADCFDEELIFDGDDKRMFVTLGQFSIIRLERDTQLVIPSYDFCMPEKECIGSNEDSPCELFRRIKFPVDEFFPTNVSSFEEYRDVQFHCQK